MQNLKMSRSLKHRAIEKHPSFAASNLVLYNQLQVHSDGSPLLEWATMRPRNRRRYSSLGALPMSVSRSRKLPGLVA